MKRYRDWSRALARAASSRPAEDWKEIGTVTVGANWLGQVVSGGGGTALAC